MVAIVLLKAGTATFTAAPISTSQQFTGLRIADWMSVMEAVVENRSSGARVIMGSVWIIQRAYVVHRGFFLVVPMRNHGLHVHPKELGSTRNNQK